MSDQDRDATVRLSADTSAYTTQIQAAGNQTATFGQQIDTLTAKLDHLSRTAGKKLLFGSAGAATFIAGATTAAAAMEKQFSTLAASTAITDRRLGDFEKSVRNISRSFPISRGEVISLETTIDKLGVTSIKSIDNIAKAMVKLSEATGEGIGGLTTGLVELGRQMGTLNTGNIDTFANSLLRVSSQAGVSAQSVLNFAQAIAPATRAAGISEKAVLGIATAFSKAGADGYAAANTFNSMLSDITRQVVTGSPAIAKYASVIGVTSKQFKDMDRAESLIQIFETINRQGPNAIKTLDSLGFDGVRALRAMQAVAQTGGIRKTITDALGSDSRDYLTQGSQAANKNLAAQLITTRNAMSDLAITAGGPFVRAFEAALRPVNALLHGLDKLAQMFSGRAQILGTIATVGAGLLGASMLASGARTGLGVYGLVRKSGMVQGTSAGLSAGRLIAGGNVAEGRWAEEEAAHSLRWWQQPFYRMGSEMGQAMGPNMSGRSTLGRVLSAPIHAATWMADTQSSYYSNIRANALDREAPTFHALGMGAGKAKDHLERIFANPAAFAAGLRGQGLPGQNAPTTISEISKTAGPKVAARFEHLAETAAQLDTAQREMSNTLGKGIEKETKARDEVVAAMRKFAGAFVRLQAESTMTAGQVAGGMAGKLARGVGSAALSTVASPMSLGIMGAFAGYSLYQRSKAFKASETEDFGTSGTNAYNAALNKGTETIDLFTQALQRATQNLPKPKTMADVATVSQQVIAVGQTPNRKLTDQRFKTLSANDEAAAYIRTLNPTPEQLQLIQADLVTKYDVGTAQRITNQVLSNAPTNYGALARASNVDASRGWSHTAGGGSALINQKVGTDVKQPLANALLYGQQQSDIYGPAYGQQTVVNKFAEELKGVFEAKGKNGLPLAARGEQLDIITKNYAANILGDKKLSSGSSYNDYLKTLPLKGGEYQGVSSQGYTNFVLSNIASKPKAKDIYGEAGISGKAIGPKELEALKDPTQTPLYKLLTSQGSGGAATGLGYSVANNKIITGAATGEILNPQKQSEAINELVKEAQKSSTSFSGTTIALNKVQHLLNDNVSEALYGFVDAAKALVAAAHASETRFGGRVSQVRDSISLYKDARSQAASNPNIDPAKFKDAAGNLIAQKDQYQDFYASIITAEHNFGIQMQRGEEDMGRSILRQKKSFFLQMKHAGEDFALQQQRSQASFDRQMKRSAEDAAKSFYDPMHRVWNQLTTDADTALMNLEEQNRLMIEQSSNLSKAKNLGLSQQAIDTLGLAKPENAQNLNRIVGDLMSDPTLIAKINQQVAARLVNVTALTQTSVSQDYTRQQQDFKLATSQATKDYHTMISRSNESFRIGMSQMQEDYGISVRRAGEDLANMTYEVIAGPHSLKSLAEQAISGIPKSIGKVGDALRSSISDLQKAFPWLFADASQILTPPTITLTVSNGGQSKDGTIEAKHHALGGIATKATSGVFGEAGPEALIPLDARGARFMAGMYSEITQQMVKQTNMIGSVPSYKGGNTIIDASTNFTGPVKVEASDPNEMARKLMEKARVKKLTRPSMVG